MDTIFALATPRGKSGVAVIRISGPAAFRAAMALAGDLPPSHSAGLRVLRDAGGDMLDQALILPFAAPRSFTGEDVVELHLHGSQAIMNAVLSFLAQAEGVRLAEPGEFTRRALENDKLDLAQVEGLADLIESETEAQRLQAMRVFSGALGDRVSAWRPRAIRAAALLEATIDFADEDVPEDVTEEVLELIGGLADELRREIDGSRIAERVRDGFEVAIVGPPNIGKSTLLNRLAQREAAITSEVAGTTRDVIEVRMDLQGLPVTILDTAGLRETSDQVERIGIERAISRAKAADLRIFLDDGETPPLLAPAPEDIVVRGKGDLLSDSTSVSGKTGQGVSNLVARIATILEGRASGVQTATHARHRRAMVMALEALENAQDMIQAGTGTAEIAAEELRIANRALDSLIGRVDVEDLLDEIFSSFCLGK